MKNLVIVLLSFMLLLVLVGFTKTYFIDLNNARLSIHFHAILMFIWMFMLIGQAILIRRKLFKSHILVGKISYVVSPLIIISGLFVTYEAIRSGGDNPPRISYEIFTLGFTTILFFALLYFLAIYYRYKTKLHMRFMIGTGFILLEAGLLRIFLHLVPWVSGFSDSTIVSYILIEVVIIVLVIKDYISGIKLSPFLIVLALIFSAHFLFWLAPDWEWWRNMSLFIGGNHK